MTNPIGKCETKGCPNKIYSHEQYFCEDCLFKRYFPVFRKNFGKGENLDGFQILDRIDG